MKFSHETHLACVDDDGHGGLGERGRRAERVDARGGKRPGGLVGAVDSKDDGARLGQRSRDCEPERAVARDVDELPVLRGRSGRGREARGNKRAGVGRGRGDGLGEDATLKGVQQRRLAAAHGACQQDGAARRRRGCGGRAREDKRDNYNYKRDKR